MENIDRILYINIIFRKFASKLRSHRKVNFLWTPSTPTPSPQVGPATWFINFTYFSNTYKDKTTLVYPNFQPTKI